MDNTTRVAGAKTVRRLLFLAHLFGKRQDLARFGLDPYWVHLRDDGLVGRIVHHEIPDSQ